MTTALIEESIHRRATSRSNRGLFIVFEGLDGAGTTTQAKKLSELISPHVPVLLTQEPSDGPLGQLIRQILRKDLNVPPKSLALTFAADRLDHLYSDAGGIAHHLEQGHWVISDRYVLSSLAYQASQGLDPAWLDEINASALKPDITVFVDTSLPKCLERISQRDGISTDLFNDERSLRLIRRNYFDVLARTSWLGELITVDGNPPIDSVRNEIVRGLTATIDRSNA